MSLEIEIAKNSGYCFGVKRALDIVERTLDKYINKKAKIYCLGQIIHNEGVVEELSKKGIKFVDEEGDIESGSIFIVRTHGMSPDIISRLKSRSVKIVDATCPFVKNAHVKARSLSKRGYFLIIIGNKKHPEVIGIKNHAEGSEYAVIENLSDLDPLSKKEKIAVVVQTTQTIENVQTIVSELIKKGKEIIVENTICNTTGNRQYAVKNLARKVDIMIIVGGKNSANTTHLAEISKKINKNTYHIENCKELKTAWLKGIKKVGISGGASTPRQDILEVKKFIEDKFE
ncbi:MAG: 4-hydroxy-3-methylbut-2-enyl diphosphate reductase [Actinobacteria bacterium]|nr:4-hydroxy-3-methylbut-2-enyl diphosphate reductase [Actinomycetota bacterium]